jgi:cytochrome c553
MQIWRMLRAAGVILVIVILLAAGAVWMLSEQRLRRVHPITLAMPREIPTDSSEIARGAHLAHIATCVLCHGEDLGGAVFSNNALLGTMAGPNLTRGRSGSLPQLTDSDFVRALRHGVRRDSTSLIVMPSEVFVRLSEPDLAAIIAYAKHAPLVDREVPRSHFGPLGRALLAAGKLNILVADKTPVIPLSPGVPSGATPAYGRYLADVTGCHGCHGFGLSGGKVAGPPGLPPASNLTPSGSLAKWTETEFAQALREGRRPDGTTINEFMPWRVYKDMTDDEVRALWLYLRSVPAKEFGNK